MKKLKNRVLLLKKEGETPLAALDAFRKRNKEYAQIKMTYAGRLDPMASGLLLVLAGKEVKNKEKYLSLDKGYEFQVLFGFATDTYDILGKVVAVPPRQPARNATHSVAGRDLARKELENKIKENLKYFTGKFIQKYPIYSSKTVKGTPLFAYAKSGVDVEIPEREVHIKKLQFLKMRKISSKKLLANVEKRIKKVKGDFRQEQILKIWRKKLARKEPHYFIIGNFKTTCSNGTYVRGVANSLGKKIDIPALAFSIKRTKIGKFDRIQ